MSACRAESVCPGREYVKLAVASPGVEHDEDDSVRYYRLAPFGNEPPFHELGSFPIQPAVPADACTTLQELHTPDVVLIVQRGNCTFHQKAVVAAQASAAGVIVVNNSTDCLYMSAPEDSQAKEEMLETVKNLFVASATNTSGEALLALATSHAAATSYSSVVINILDGACVVLLALALITIAIAAIWSGKVFEDCLRKERARRSQAAHEPDGLLQQPNETGSEQVAVTVPIVLVFVGASSVMMFLLFFVLNSYIFYIFIAIFSYGSCIATAVCLQALLRATNAGSARVAFQVQRFEWSASYGDIVSGVAAVVLVAIWLFNRHASWAFVPQNILGMFFMVMIMQTITLPDARVATVFLFALFAYDIFMVFVTPLFMPHGDSVMVKVARGGSSHEIMPMLLMVPRFAPPLHSAMMLGYGDVVVPGLLVCFLRRFDIVTGRKKLSSYMLPTLVAYALGLGLTYAALAYEVGGSQGQPALLYLVPCTLGTMWTLAYVRGDVGPLWAGRIEDVKDHASGSEEQYEEDSSAGQSASRGVVPESGAFESEQLV